MDPLQSEHIMSKVLPGFFFDEEKGKYFPNSMKAAYDKEKRARKAAEKQRKMQEDLRNTKEADLYKYLVTQPQRFDMMKEKISRLNMIPIAVSASNHYHFDLKNGRYHEMSQLENFACFKTLSLPQDASSPAERICDSLTANHHPLMSFAVVYIDETTSVYFYIYSKLDWLYFNIFDERESYPDIPIKDSGSKVLIHGKHIFVINWLDNFKELQVIKVDKDPVRQKLDIGARTRYVLWHPETGFVQSTVMGNFQIPKKKISLRFDEKETAKWLHYYRGIIFYVTFYDTFGCFHVEKPNRRFDLLNLKDSDIYNDQNTRLLVEAVNRIVVFGYVKGKQLLFYDLDTYKVIHRKSLDHEIRQFKISADLKNLYILHDNN